MSDASAVARLFEAYGGDHRRMAGLFADHSPSEIAVLSDPGSPPPPRSWGAPDEAREAD